MNKIKMLFLILYQKILRGWKNIHILFFFIYVWFLCDIYLRPMGSFIQSVGVKASPYGFVFLMDQRNFMLLFFLGIVFAFSDVPFRYKVTRYTVLRSGIPTWTISNLIYLWICSLLFTIMGIFLSLLPVWGNFTLQSGWGKIYGTLAQTNAGEFFNLPLEVSYQVLLDYTPIGAILHISLIMVLLNCLIGKILFFFGMWYKRVIGSTIVIGMVLFTGALGLLGGYKPLFFSPVSWVSLSNLTTFRGNGLPVFQDVILVFAVLHLLISIAIYWKSFKSDFYDS